MGIYLCKVCEELIDGDLIPMVECLGEYMCADCEPHYKADCQRCLGVGSFGERGSCSACNGTGKMLSQDESDRAEYYAERPRGGDR